MVGQRVCQEEEEWERRSRANARCQTMVVMYREKGMCILLFFCHKVVLVVRICRRVGWDGCQSGTCTARGTLGMAVWRMYLNNSSTCSSAKRTRAKPVAPGRARVRGEEDICESKENEESLRRQGLGPGRGEGG